MDNLELTLAKAHMARKSAQVNLINAEQKMLQLELFVQHQQALQFVQQTQQAVQELPGYSDWIKAREAFNLAAQAEAEAEVLYETRGDAK